MATKFEAVNPIDSGIRYVGFDTGPLPDWFMVPLNKEKDIALLDAEDMTITPTNPAVAEIIRNVPLFGGPSNRRLTIRGRSKGHTYIEVRKRGVLITQLEVSVKKLLQKTLAFHFVSDAPDASGKSFSTARAPGEVDNWMRELNRIYTPQTNIEFLEKSRRRVQLSRSLGEEITFDRNLYQGGVNDRAEWDTVVALKNNAADINIFLVWSIECDNDPLRDSCIGYHAFKDCLVEDAAAGDTWDVTQTIAHEIGHALGVVQHLVEARNNDCLMYRSANGRNTRIPKIHANVFNGPV